MKLIRRRDYNTKDRLGFEGLYLEQSGFKKGSLIDYDINFKSKSILIKLSKKKTVKTNSVTQNITRSGKTVPAICIRNKNIEKFLKNTPNLEILIFNGVIIISSKDCNSNAVLGQAILVHNNSLKESYRKVVQLLIDMNLLNDELLLSEIDLINKDNFLSSKRLLYIPRKVIGKLKKSFTKSIISNIQAKNNLCICSSNSFILSSIFRETKGSYGGNDEEDEDILKDIIQCFLKHSFNTVNCYYYRIISIQVSDTLLKGYSCKYSLSFGNILIACEKRIDRCYILLLSILKIISYLDTIIDSVILYKGLYFILFRKEINTLSPPLLSNTA